jgi:CheY-like chemotaxis protein
MLQIPQISEEPKSFLLRMMKTFEKPSFWSYKTMELNTGERVLTTAIEIQPAAIVLDLAMPVVTGYEALLALKENPATAGIPVIIASAQRGSGVVNTVRDLGAINFLLKPWQEDELVPLVQQAIDSAAE